MERKAKDNEEMVTNNLKLVYKITNEYFGQWKYRKQGLFDYEDLIQIGLIGLIKACNDFNPSLGYKFSTYASRKIRSEITMFFRDVFCKSRVKEKKITKLVSTEDKTIKDFKFEELLKSDGFEDETIDIVIFNEFLETLNEREKKVLYLRYNNMSQTKIAKEVGINQSSVSLQIKRIKEKYKKYCNII